MSRDFSKNLSNFIRLGTGTVGAVLNGAGAISFHVWAWADTLSTADFDNVLISIQIAAGGSVGIEIFGHDGTNPKLIVGCRAAGGETFRRLKSTTNITTGSWLSLGGVINIAGDTITPYFNGVAEGGGAAAFTATSYTQGSPDLSDSIGAYISLGNTPSSTHEQWDGRLAHMALWKSDIGANAFASLAKGILPHRIGPLPALYWPLWGLHSPEIELIANKVATINGTIAAATDAPVQRFTRTPVVVASQAGFNPAWARQRSGLIGCGKGAA